MSKDWKWIWAGAMFDGRLVRRRVRTALAVLLALSTAAAVRANGLRVVNAGLARQDTVNKTAMVTFDLSWENSWRDGDRRDAAWVFVKFRAPGSNTWEHAILSANSADHRAAAGSEISAVPDGRGALVYGAGDHAGSVSYPRTWVQWRYGSNGYDFASGAVVEVSVYAVEMVHIPEDAFYLGSGGSEAGHFYRYTDGSQSTNPFLVESEAEIAVGAAGESLYYAGVPTYGDGSGPISNDFPKGFAAFYCMKYEISQGQYCDFLNTLTLIQDAARVLVAYGSGRHTIGGQPGARTVGAPDRACNYLEWADITAYADWAGLRPMSELEYEKACRGPAQPVPNEYAWGDTTAVAYTGCAGTDGSGTETALPTNANHVTSYVLPPVRVGLFARAGATRQLSGAGYYGVMELDGNMTERVVAVGTNAGRAFMGTHGDGVLAANGDPAGNPDWPDVTGNGSGCRGGSHWSGGGNYLKTSNRQRMINSSGGWASVDGGRCARTAP